ncbi:mechanosensitive ion channel family protein [Pseudahrensia aquimaris]|uniref:Small-conductance mechanosensitive channel n=1 Tax=Pseudahrensia aquimaris TaxID=744461 RepID=A0ABW3FD52_9HYPH
MFARFFFALFLAIASLSFATYNSAFAQDAAQPSGPIQTDDKTEADSAIRDRLREIYREIAEFRNIFVTVQSGVVTIKGRVLETTDVERAAELAARVDGVVSVNNQVSVETSVEKRIAPALERFMARVNQVVAFLPLLAIAVVVFAVIALFGFMIARMRRPWDSLTPNRFVSDLLRQIIRLAFLIIGLVIALDIMGATALLGTIVGAAGIFGLAIGFAVRDTVENYIASILLSFRQPFRPKDYVDVEGREGSVIALTSRATILMTADGNHVRIPNSTVFKSTITNYSLNPERRFDFQLGVQTDDPQTAVTLGVETISALSFTLKDPAPDGWIKEIGPSSVEIWLGGWVNQSETSLLKAKGEAIRKVLAAFKAAGIDVPAPTYRVAMDGEVKATGKKPAKAPTRKATAKAAAIKETEGDVSADTVIDQKIDEQIRQSQGQDLLNSDAQQEIG